MSKVFMSKVGRIEKLGKIQSRIKQILPSLVVRHFSSLSFPFSSHHHHLLCPDCTIRETEFQIRNQRQIRMVYGVHEPSLMSRGVNFFRGQGGMKARIDRHSRTFLGLFQWFMMNSTS